MLYLILAILSNVGILIAFRIAGKHKVHSLSMVTINYFVASVFGLLVYILSVKTVIENINILFLPSALLIGIIFMLMFLLVQRVINFSGIAITSVAAKFSVVFPIIVSLIIDPYDKISISKGVGFFLMFLALVFILYNPEQLKNKSWNILLPVYLFIGLGFVDSILKISQQYVIGEGNVPLFTLITFCVAGISGVIYLLWNGELNKIFNQKSFLLGILLGICNYGSLFFLVKVLNLNLSESKFLDSSRIFMFNNLVVILVSVLIGIIIFREKLNSINYLGFAFSVLGFYMLI